MRLLIPYLFALTIAPDLGERLAKWKPVRMPYDSSGLTAREKQVVDKLVQASRFLEKIIGSRAIPRRWSCTRPRKTRGLSAS